MHIILNILLDGIAVFVAGYILPGVHLQSFLTAIIVGIVLGVINTFVKPLLLILTLPITILTLGLFYLIINGIVVLIVSAIVPGFHVDNLFWAILLSIVISITSTFLHQFNK